MTNALAELKDEDAEIGDLGITPEHLIELDKLIADGKISANIAKKLFKGYVEKRRDAVRAGREKRHQADR